MKTIEQLQFEVKNAHRKIFLAFETLFSHEGFERFDLVYQMDELMDGHKDSDNFRLTMGKILDNEKYFNEILDLREENRELKKRLIELQKMSDLLD